MVQTLTFFSRQNPDWARFAREGGGGSATAKQIIYSQCRAVPRTWAYGDGCGPIRLPWRQCPLSGV